MIEDAQISPSTLLSDLKSPEFAAKYLVTTPATLAVWRCAKRYPLRFVRIGRKIFYRLRDLEQFIAARTEPGDGDGPDPSGSSRRSRGRSR